VHKLIGKIVCARVTQKEKLDLLGHLFKVEYTYKTAAEWEPRYNPSPRDRKPLSFGCQ
jgi:hypothetical protein